MKRKFLILGAALLMMAGAAACSNQGSANETTAALTEAAKEKSTEADSGSKEMESENKEKSTEANSDSKGAESENSEKFPEFQAKTVDGEDITSDIFKDNKLTVVNVWGSWCGPCVQEIPELQKLYENMKDKGVNVIGIAQDATTDMDAVKEIIEQNKVTYQNIVPEGAVMDLIMGIQAFPTTYLVDAQGNIVSSLLGGRDLDSFTKAVEDALAKM